MVVAGMSSPGKAPLPITEFSISSVHAGADVDTGKLLDHVRHLVADNEWVMLTRLRQNFKLSSYIRRYSQQPLRFVMGVSTLTMLFYEKFYTDSGTGILEAIGKLFTQDVKIYVKPMSVEDFHQHLNSVSAETPWFDIAEDAEVISSDNLTFHGPMQRLFQYLLESDAVEALEHKD